MANIRFIHTADLHLDSPFKGLSDIPVHIYQQLKLSTFNAFDRLIDYCIEKKVDFLLISGDLYDLEDRSIKAQIHFFKGVEKLNQHNIHTYIIHGNHDPLDQINTSFIWPDTVHFFSAEKVESLSFFKDGREAARIYGRSYPTKSFKENIVKQYQVENDRVFNIGLLHTNIDNDPLHEAYAPCTLSELMNTKIDYWALGHIHKGKILSEKSPAIIYPGNTQGRHINEAGIKGAVLVEASDKSVDFITMLPTSNIMWENIAIDLTDIDTINELISMIENRLEEQLTNVELPVIARLNLSGSTNLYKELNKEGAIEDIKYHLNQSFTGKKLWVLLQKIEVNLKPPYSLDVLMEQDTFLALFLKQIKQLENNLDLEINEQVLTELLNNQSIRRHLPEFNRKDFQQVYRQIIKTAVDFLHDEEM